MWENSIHTNGGLCIDLGDNDVTANDDEDTDSGPNSLQNFPTSLTLATRDGVASARFGLEVTANRVYIIDYYSSDSCDSAGNGEGKQWLGFTPALGSRTGNLAFTASTLQRSIRSYSAPTGTHITATATDAETNSTSEFSTCIAPVALPALVISVDTVEATEDAATAATYTVALPSAPSADTKVILSVSDDSVATISTTEITFTTTDWSEDVTVTPVSDDDPLNETTDILHLVSIGDHEFPTALLPVEVIDDDALGLTLTHADFPIDVSVGHNYDGLIELAEGDTAIYSVALADEPSDDVTITLSSSNSDALTLSKDTTDPKTFSSSLTLTFEKDKYDEAQDVTLKAKADMDASDEIGTITHEADIGGKDYVLAKVRAFVRDSAVPALTLVPDTGEVTIPTDGGTVTYTIVPAVVPSSELTVNLASSDVDVVTVMPSSLTFTVGTSGNWETPQTVTVTSVADDDEFDDQAEIEHTAVLHGITYRWGSVFVTVTDGNRAPYFEEGLDTTREVPESASQGIDVGAPVTALDLNTSDTLTYTLDDPSGNFAITLSNSTTGQITVAANNSLDYEIEQDYSMEVVVSDRAADGLTDKIEVKVLVTDVNEPPVITGEAAPTFEENRTGRIGRYRATDPEGKPFSRAVSESEPRNFSIDGNGYLSFSVTPDFEDKSSYYVSIVAADDKLLPGYLDVTVAIVDIDEPPTITGDDTLTFAENTETTTTLHTYRASDPERVTTTFTWSLGGTDSGDFNISNQGELTFRNTPNYERPADSGGNNEYNITVRASDGSLTGTKDVTVTVTDVNEAPTTPTGRDGISVAENTSANLSRYSSSDPERATIEWSVTGTDANDFRIDSSGNLAFDGAPDYETPGDSGGNQGVQHKGGRQGLQPNIVV